MEISKKEIIIFLFFSSRHSLWFFLAFIFFAIPRHQKEKGKFITLVGRSGSGKTTLLNMLAGLDHPTSGQVLFEGMDLSDYNEKQFIQLRRHRIGVVFQSFALLPLLSAYENVELPMRIAGIGAKERSSRTNEVLEMVGLGRRAKHRPYELSGGEQQRVAVARALCNEPKVLLADEPSGNLDSQSSEALHQLLFRLREVNGLAMIIVTHSKKLAEMTDRVLELRDGKLLEDGMEINGIE